MSDGLGTDWNVRFGEWLEWAQSRLASLMPDYRPPGALGDRGADSAAPQSPGHEVRFVFESDAADASRAWRAELRVPPDSTVGTEVPIFVMDANGVPIVKGVLELSGCSVPIENGRGSLLFELFVSGARHPHVSLSREGLPAEIGALTFFGEGKS